MPDDAYDPACIRLLAGMEPPKRPAGFIQDGPAGRVALPVEDLSDAEMAAIMASRPIGPDYSLDDIPGVEGGLSAAREREQAYAESVYQPDPAELTPAYREAWARGLPRCPVEDGPGSGQRVELSVRVLVGLSGPRSSWPTPSPGAP